MRDHCAAALVPNAALGEQSYRRQHRSQDPNQRTRGSHSGAHFGCGILPPLMRISAEVAPATMATRGQSHAPDRGADSRSAGFPTPPPAAIPPTPFPLVPLSTTLFSALYPCPWRWACPLPSCPLPCCLPFSLPPISPPSLLVVGHGRGHLACLPPCLYLVLVSRPCPAQ